MNDFANRINDIIMRCRRFIFLTNQRAKLKNMNFTLISNNCVGGVIYHNLGLRFTSPTINLYIPGDDYLQFVKALSAYLVADITEDTLVDYPFPVGIIDPKDGVNTPIHVYFQHYKTYEDARIKWIERAKRVNFSNLYFIWEFYDDVYDSALIEEFDCLPINKMCLLHKDIIGVKNKHIFHCCNGDWEVGKLLKYDGITGKMFLDDFDYVSFINNNE